MTVNDFKSKHQKYPDQKPIKPNANQSWEVT